ncbi:hypothetical protein ACX5DZ_005081 [Enterobacter hormaechei]
MTTSINLDFTFDALDKRFDQISFKLVTVNDRLIYARMANEFKLYKDKPGGYTPTMTSLAVTGGFSDRKPVMKTFQRLKDAGLLVQHETKSRQPLQFTVLSIDQALKVNPQLLSMPTMAERRANGLQLERKGRKPRSVVLDTTVNHKQDILTVVPEPLDCSSRDNSTVVPKTTDCSSRDTHERIYKEQERSFKEVQSQNQDASLSQDNDLLNKVNFIGDKSVSDLNLDEEITEQNSVKKEELVTKTYASMRPASLDDDDYFEPDEDDCDFNDYSPAPIKRYNSITVRNDFKF